MNEPRTEERVGSLDEAWREAEAALPEGWQLGLSRLDAADQIIGWAQSKALWEDGGYDHEDEHIEVDGLTPTLALQALTALLRDKAVSR